jgi:hypothetical protein
MLRNCRIERRLLGEFRLSPPEWGSNFNLGAYLFLSCLKRSLTLLNITNVIFIQVLFISLSSLESIQALFVC